GSARRASTNEARPDAISSPSPDRATCSSPLAARVDGEEEHELRLGAGGQQGRAEEEPGAQLAQLVADLPDRTGVVRHVVVEHHAAATVERRLAEGQLEAVALAEQVDAVDALAGAIVEGLERLAAPGEEPGPGEARHRAALVAPAQRPGQREHAPAQRPREGAERARRLGLAVDPRELADARARQRVEGEGRCLRG